MTKPASPSKKAADKAAVDAAKPGGAPNNNVPAGTVEGEGNTKDRLGRGRDGETDLKEPRNKKKEDKVFESPTQRASEKKFKDAGRGQNGGAKKDMNPNHYRMGR